MKTFFSAGTLRQVMDHLPEKLAASAGIATIADALGVQVQLILIFIFLAFADIVTRWIAQSARLWHDLYPQTDVSVWRAAKFCWQAHKWRYIESEKMRDRFISKIGTYALILIVASLGDVAMKLAGGPRFLLTVITAVLSCTECLSCLENLHEAGVKVASELMAIIKKRKEQIK